jgi:alkylresorcinol/alkylpyrone synthase
MTSIASVHGVLPEYRYPQAEITGMLSRVYGVTGRQRALLERLHANSGVRYRHLAMPLERYGSDELNGFGATNSVFVEVAVELGERAVRGALDDAGLLARDIDLVLFTSVTGIAAPSIDARIAGRLGLRPDVKRLPIFGLGCVAGAAGIARLHDFLTGGANQVALLLSVELCSLTLQRDDSSTAGLVASALFGDGAAAVLATSGDAGSAASRIDAAPGASVRWPEIVATRSALYPGTEHVLGWDVTDTGLRILLDAAVPDVVRANIGVDVHGFLDDHGLKPQDITAWVCHPAGPKVLDAVSDALDLPGEALDLSRASLAAKGNLSSASVLHLLRDTVLERRPPAGTPGLLLAMGPGFSTELVLLRW